MKGCASALVEAAVNLEADLVEAREGAEALETRLRLAEEKIHSQVGWGCRGLVQVDVHLGVHEVCINCTVCKALWVRAWGCAWCM